MDTELFISRVSNKLVKADIPVGEIQDRQQQIKLASNSVSSLIDVMKDISVSYTVDLSDELEILDLMQHEDMEVKQHDNWRISDTLLQAGIGIFSNKDKAIIKFKKKLTLAQTIRLGKSIFDNLLSDKVVMPILISPSEELVGIITSQIDAHKKNIVLAQVADEKIGKEERKGIRFPIFGEKPFPPAKQNVLTYETEFYLYRFETKSRKEYVLLSKEKLAPGFFKITGVVAPLKDETKLGEKATIGSGVDLIIPYSIESNVRLISQKEFENIVSDWTEEQLMEQIFGKFRHPKPFEHLIAAWLFSGKHQFDLHLGIIAKAGTGKSSLLECLDINYDEIERIFDGSQGTMKGLVPSYYQTAKEGYYAKCRRMALVDEFFTTLTRSSGGKKPEQNDETGLLTSLLEQKLRTGASAKGQLEVHPTAKALFATNPKYGLKTLPEIADKLNRAFLSRILWYIQPDSHIAFVESRKQFVQTIADPYPHYNPDFVSVTDYLHSVKLQAEPDKIRRIYDQWLPFVPEALIEVYEARSLHHILALADGVSKLNYIIHKRKELGITEEDYNEASELFGMCISSWNVDQLELSKLPPRLRVQFIPIHERQVYNTIDKQPMIFKKDIDQIIGVDVRRTLARLESLGLVKWVDDDGNHAYIPFWHYLFKGETTNTLGGVASIQGGLDE